MKKVGDIMQELGFRKEAPDSVKEAFLKHLIHAATGQVVETPSEKKQRIHEAGEQLCFDFTKEKSPPKRTG